LLSGNFIQEGLGSRKIAGIYKSEPNVMRRDGDPMHYGGLLLEVCSCSDACLEGEYWTDRNTKGTLRFDQRVPKIIDNYDLAHLHFQNLDPLA